VKTNENFIFAADFKKALFENFRPSKKIPTVENCWLHGHGLPSLVSYSVKKHRAQK
jgi:hypothetical protein